MPLVADSVSISTFAKGEILKPYKNESRLVGNKIIKRDIVANRGKIIEIVEDIVADEQTEVFDCTGKYLLPALVDIHTHGANGYDFNTADLDGIKKILHFYVNHGVYIFQKGFLCFFASALQIFNKNGPLC